MERKYSSRYIFLSYGHDSYTNLANRLKQELEKRGHIVWTDSELKTGDDWEEKIENAIDEANARKPNGCFILLMSSHSIRKPGGYCLNELARAVGYGLFTIPIKLQNIDPPLSIARIQYLDMSACALFSNETADFKRQYELLIDAIENDSVAFDGAQTRLQSLLKPISFQNEIKKYSEKFTGRLWVYNQINEWIHDSNSSRVFWLTGAPGIGKTAISIWLSCVKIPEIQAWHLCQHTDSITGDPKRCILSLAYYLASQIEEYKNKLFELNLEELVNIGSVNVSTLFRRILIDPLNELPFRSSPVIILIDALDESEMVNGENQLAKFIGSNFEHFPSWLKLIITSRPVHEVEKWFRRFNPYKLNASDNRNNSDIKRYVEKRLNVLINQLANRNDIIDKIADKSEGIFLYAEILCNSILAGEISVHNSSDFPNGLYCIYENYFNQRFPTIDKYKNQVVGVLQFILAGKEPMTSQDIDDYFYSVDDEWDESSFDRFKKYIGAYFHIVNNTVIPFHKSIADWLTNDSESEYYVSRKRGNKRIIEWGLLYRNKYATMPQYLLKHIISHCIGANKTDEVILLLTNKELFTCQVKLLGFDDAMCLYFDNIMRLHDIASDQMLKIYESDFFISLMAENRRYILDNGYFLDLRSIQFDDSLQKLLSKDDININSALLYYLYATERFEQIINIYIKIEENRTIYNSLSADTKSQMCEVYGLSLRKIGDFEGASKAFYDTIKFGEYSSNSYQISLGYANIAKIDYHTLNFNDAYNNNYKAFEYLSQSLIQEDICSKGKQISVRLFLAEYKRLAAECYIWGERFTAAQEALQYTEEVYSQIKLRDRYYPRYLYTSALLKIAVGDINEACLLLHQAKKLCRNIYDNATVNYYFALLFFLNKSSDTEEAKTHIEQAIELFTSIGAKIEVSETVILSKLIDKYDICPDDKWGMHVCNFFTKLNNK